MRSAKSELGRLRAQLKRHRELILAGNFEELAKSSNKTGQILDRIGTGMDGADPVDLADIRRAAEGNQHLIDAAKRGVERAMRRLSELTEVTQSTQTYGCDGQRQTIRHDNPKQNRRF